MDVYLHAHFILHGVVHNTDAALNFTRHYCHVVSQNFERSGLLCVGSEIKLAALVSVAQHELKA